MWRDGKGSKRLREKRKNRQTVKGGGMYGETIQRWGELTGGKMSLRK